MQKTLNEIAKIVKGEIIGDGDIAITGFSGLKEAVPGDLTFLDNQKYLYLAEETKASAILTRRDIPVKNKTVILVDNPSLSFTDVISACVEESPYSIKGIDNAASISADAELDADVTIGANAFIGRKSKIASNTKIYAGSYIGNTVVIGSNCIIYPNVTILDNIKIGNDVIIHSGTVIGADGFGFINVDGKHKKIPQIGTVVVEDDVEIGANVTIDRARFDKTFIGKGTKIDNLVQIAHNVIIGQNCLIIAQVGISGSVNVGDNAILAGQVGVVGHLTIGEGCVVASRGVVTKSIPSFTKVSGNPAKEDKKAKKIQASVQRLPLYVKAIHELEKRIASLEEEMKEIK